MALKVGELFATLNLDTSGFNTSITSATNLATSEGKAISAILGGIKLGKELVDSAIDFETAFAGVKKTVDETALTSYEDLEKQIRKLSTELPATAEEIARIYELSGQLGIGANDLENFSRVMINLGETTNLSSEEAATSLARFANIMGTSSDEYSNLGSTIVDLGNNFATTESEIVGMAMRIAGAGKQIGLTESDVLGFAAAFSSVGINVEAGGSAFSSVIAKMALAASQGEEGLAGFANVAGMTAASFKETFEKDAAGAVLAFVKGLGKSENAIGILKDLEITEIRERQAMLGAAEASDIFAEAINMSSNAYAENNALSEEAAKRYETTASKMDVLKNKTADLGLGFGKIGKDITDVGLDFALNAMDKISETPVTVADGLAESAKSTAQRYLSFVEKDIGNLETIVPMMFTPKMDESTSIVLRQLLIENGYINEAGEIIDVPVIANPIPAESATPPTDNLSGIVSAAAENTKAEIEVPVEVSSVQAATLGNGAKTELGNAGTQAGQLFNSSLGSALANTSGVSAALSQITTSVRNQALGISASGTQGGKMFSSGLAAGIRAGKSSITSAAREVARAAVSAANAELKIKSPSRVMMKSGGYFGEGFAGGILKEVTTVRSAASYMANMAASAALIRNPAGRWGGMGNALAQIAGGNAGSNMPPIRLTTYLNGREVSEAMSDDTAYTQNDRIGRIALRYGTVAT